VLVAPTNRRPYGYDWEDWGRADALEVLEAEAREDRQRAARRDQQLLRMHARPVRREQGEEPEARKPGQ